MVVDTGDNGGCDCKERATVVVMLFVSAMLILWLMVCTVSGDDVNVTKVSVRVRISDCDDVMMMSIAMVI